MTNKNNLESLRATAETKENEMVERSKGNLWLPHKSDLLVENDKGEMVYQDGITDKQRKDEFIRSIIPHEITSHETESYGTQFDLEFIDVDTGEKKRVPLHANLLSRLQDCVDENLDMKEEKIEYDDVNEVAMIVRYCGKLNSMKDGDKRKYHTWQGELIISEDE